jgi:excisionase family DNA binding protein
MNQSKGGEMPEEYLTVTEAAAILKVSIETIRRYLRAGKLKNYKIGRQYRIRRPDLEALLTNGGAEKK